MRVFETTEGFYVDNQTLKENILKLKKELHGKTSNKMKRTR